MSNSLKNAWTDFALKSTFSVRADLTLKKARWTKNKNGKISVWVRLNEYRARENNRIFLDRLNKRVFGNAYRRYGKKLNVMLVLESDDLKRMHVHALLEHPSWLSIDDFIRLIDDAWSAAPWSYEERCIEEIKSLRGSVLYNLKTGVDAIDLENTNISPC